MHVKICGIQTVKDAKRAQQLGADAIGVLVGRVHSSSDFVSPDTAAELCRSVGPFMPTILVTHFEDPASILKLAEKVPASGIQLHSDLPPRTIKSLARKLFPRKIIAKVSVDGPGALRRARQVAKVADAILLDSIDRQANRVGGTGNTHNWTISAQIVRESPIPVVLAGGLTPKNVGRAIHKVKPYGVDVNSGVKNQRGGKSQRLIQEFIRAAKNT